MVYTLLNTRRCYTHIRTGAQAVILDENVIQQYLEAYWLEQFPDTHVAYELSIRKNSIQIVADLPALPLSEQKQFLEKVKHDFSEYFWMRFLGYPHDVHLIASFQADGIALT